MTAPTSTEMATAIHSDDLIGKKVKNNWDETVGSIDGLLVSSTDARIVGVVLDVGSFLGIGGKEQLQRDLAYEKPKS